MRNDIVMASFKKAFTSEGVTGLVYKASTAERPSGLASLLKKYRPFDVMFLVELRQRLNKASMKRGADPSTLLAQLGAISNQFTVPGKPLDE